LKERRGAAIGQRNRRDDCDRDYGQRNAKSFAFDYSNHATDKQFHFHFAFLEFNFLLGLMHEMDQTEWCNSGPSPPYDSLTTEFPLPHAGFHTPLFAQRQRCPLFG
jgi:hypothetical protein